MMLRYVILRHENIPEPHFDLMFEQSPGSMLMTWRASRWPIDEHTKLIRLSDHRREYLDYEGPISGDRGSVKRIARGMCSVSDSFQIELDDGKKFTLSKI